MKFKFGITLCCLWSIYNAQDIKSQLHKATQQLLQSPKMYAGHLSFYVADTEGNLIYEYQGNKGLSTASTQKIFTALAALDILGENYQYQTTLSHSGNIQNGELKGNLYLNSTGDPTLGSWRYAGYQPKDFLDQIKNTLIQKEIRTVAGDLIIDDSYFDFQTIPGGWAWNDIGNYYGAGIWGTNWRENQFDLKIKGGTQTGSPTNIQGLSYPLAEVSWVNDATSGSPNSGDQSYIYTAPHSHVASINGTLPAQKTSIVSGATPNPPLQLGTEIKNSLKENNIVIKGEIKTASQMRILGKTLATPRDLTPMLSYSSPPLKQIIYWFLRKSVNLYGEALIKTMAKTQGKSTNFEQSVALLKSFWQNKNIHPAMIHFSDGSGLSPQNYASAKAEVQALVWARKQKWFPIFYEALPLYNGMKMKSGTIKATKGYTGYHTSSKGKTYIFSILVNNYDGNSINKEIFKVLNTLK